MFSSIFTRDSCPSFKLVSNAGRVFTSIAKISENFEEKCSKDLRLFRWSSKVSWRPAAYFTWRIQAQMVTGGNWDLRKTNSSPVLPFPGRSWVLFSKDSKDVLGLTPKLEQIKFFVLFPKIHCSSILRYYILLIINEQTFSINITEADTFSLKYRFHNVMARPKEAITKLWRIQQIVYALSPSPPS